MLSGIWFTLFYSRLYRMSREDIPTSRREGPAARIKTCFCRLTYKLKKILKTVRLIKIKLDEKSTFS